MSILFRSTLFAALTSFCLYIPSETAANPNADANALIVRAVQAWQNYESVAGEDIVSYEQRVEKLREVSSALDSVVEDYSSSDFAVQLVIGESIGPLSIVMVRQAKRAAELKLQLTRCAASPTIECMLDLAQEAYTNSDGELPDFILGDIAEAEARAGFLSRSFVTIERIDSVEDREKAFSKVSIHLSEMDRIEEAFNVASNLEIDSLISHSYAAIAIAQIRLGNLQDVSAGFQKVTDQGDRQKVIIEFATAISKNGQLIQAQELLETLGDIYQSSALLDIVKHRIETSDFATAMEIASSIPAPSYNCEAVISIGEALNDNRIIRELEGSVRAMDFAFDQEQCLRAIGIRTGRSELLAEARKLAAESAGFAPWYAMIDELDAGLYDEAYLTALTDAPVKRSNRLSIVATRAAEAGKLQLAESILLRLNPQDEAEVRGAIWSNDPKKEHITRLFAIASDIEDHILAESAVSNFVRNVDNVARLQEVTAIAMRIPPGSLREGALSHIAQTYAKNEMYSEALKILLQIDEPEFFISSLLEILAEMR